MDATRVTEIPLDLGSRSYRITIGAGLRHRGDLLAGGIRGHQVLIVTDTRVAPLYLDDLRGALQGYRCEVAILPEGEAHKQLSTVTRLFDLLVEQRFERSATLVALGGGVVGDMAGFAAACYQRGVSFIQVPTTLLAQVDSSVGGKTGVNHPLGKNMIGAFHQPTAVVIDTETLATLDERNFLGGLAEVIKYGVIRDPAFFRWLEGQREALLRRDLEALREAIATSCRNKAEVVAADEFESGQRAQLNFGHTFGHAIEAGTGYGTWTHGEAVAVGMAMATDLSCRLGWLAGDQATRIRELIAGVGLPVDPPGDLSVDRWLALMAADKKVAAGRLRLVLLRGIGQALVTDDYDQRQLRALLAGPA